MPALRIEVPSFGPSEQTHVGDEFASYADRNISGIMCLMRYGGYVSLIHQTSFAPQVLADNGTQTRWLNTLLLRRMSEAWSGDVPDTTLRDVKAD